MTRPTYNHKLKVMQGAPLALWANQDNAGPYVICQVHVIHASFGERVVGVGTNGSAQQRRAFDEALLTWTTVREILETEDGPFDYGKTVKTVAKIARKLRAKYSTTIAIEGAEGQTALEREALFKSREALGLNNSKI